MKPCTTLPRRPVLLAGTALMATLAVPCWAGDDEPPPGPPPWVDGPAGPSLGVQAQSRSYSQVLDDCTSASLFVEDDGRRVAWCLAPVYITDLDEAASATTGSWARSDSRLPLPSNVFIPYEPAHPDRPWWWGGNEYMAQGAASRAKASPTSLHAGAFARHQHDRVWRWDPDGNPPFNGSNTGIGHEGLEEITRSSATAEARSVDQITVHGSGRLSFVFRLDGLYEAGRFGPAPGGGGFAFGVALYDRSQLRWINTGDQLIPIWLSEEEAYRFDGISYGASPTGLGPEVSTLLREPGLAGFRLARFGGDAPDGSPFDGSFSVSLDVLDGTVLTLSMALQVAASGFESCDSEPGDGRGCFSGGDIFDNSTLIDFGNSARLTAILVDGGITGLSSAVGADYAALISVVPEPATWALWLLGTAAVLRAGQRRPRPATAA